jgi:cellulose synthase/poly-beta-1,6-N-acetylglucosamine synthase-like glycosyltransferase
MRRQLRLAQSDLTVAAHSQSNGPFAVITGKVKRDHLAMNDLPKISIVIPAYNVAAYIAETLESVFAQTF